MPDDDAKFGRGLVRLVAEVKLIWQLVTSFVAKVGDEIERAGNLTLEALYIARRIKDAVTLHAGPWLLVPILFGLSSPVFHGWGISYLAESELRTWSPVVVIPLGALFFWTTIKAGESDSNRDLDDRQATRVEPEVAKELAAQTKQRQMGDQALHDGKAGQDSGAVQGVPLHEDDLVQDVMSARYLRFFRSFSEEISIALLEITSQGAKLREPTRGFIEDDLKSKLELSLTDLFVDHNKGFDGAVEPFGYHCEPIGFSIADRHYVLLGISMTRIKDLALVELSRAATEIVANYVFGADVPQWMVAEADA